MITHTVQKGDTLWKLSKANGISLEALIAANPQIPNPDKIDVGMQVMIPTDSTIQTPDITPAPVPAAMPAPSPFPEPATAPEPVGGHMEKTPATAILPAPAPTGMAPLPAPAPAPAPIPADTGFPTPDMTAPPLTQPAYPSVPKWEGLWKYVVKNGDSLFKIAKQVGVTLEQLKAANPQVPNPDKIYPGQVLNIPSSGMKPKTSNPGYSLKEQLTAPMGVTPLSPKEQLTQPKEMAPMETPISAPVSPISTAPMPAMPMPMPSPFEINANINWAPHVNKETNVGYFPHHNQMQQAQAVSPAATGPTIAKQEMNPDWHAHMMHYYAHLAPYMHMYYLPVKMKKKHHHKKCGCKHHKCGCHKHHHHHHAHWAAYHQHLMMMQHMGMHPKTFYREED